MTAHGLNEQQLQKMKTQPGFIAALDQSGGSTPNALRLYGSHPVREHHGPGHRGAADRRLSVARET